MDTPQAVLSRKKVAEILGVTEAHLKRLHSEGGGPPACMIGKRKIAYKIADLNSWLDARTVTSTADARQRGLAA